MSAEIAGLVILAALLHATWNALVKSGDDRFALLTLTMVSAGLFALPVLAFQPLPKAESWPFLIASVALHQVYFATLISAYRHGDLSHVYPIARGAAPLLVALGGWLLASEKLTLAETAGLVILSGGILSLARGSGDRKAILFALATSLMIGLYSITDALGVRLSGKALSYISWNFVLSALPILAFAAFRRRGRIGALVRVHGRIALGAGLVTATAYGIAIWALGQAPMAHVIALRETSVLFAALIGALLLKEPFGPQRIAAAAVIVLGAALLHLGG